MLGYIHSNPGQLVGSRLRVDIRWFTKLLGICLHWASYSHDKCIVVATAIPQGERNRTFGDNCLSQPSLTSASVFLLVSSPAAYTPSCCSFSCGPALCWGAWDRRVFGETSQIHCQECLFSHILCHLPCLVFKLYVVLVCSAPHQHLHVLSQLSHIFKKKKKTMN